jgi:hypothetical protein
MLASSGPDAGQPRETGIYKLTFLTLAAKLSCTQLAVTYWL